MILRRTGRRLATATLLLLATPLAAEPQQGARIPRLCYLALSPAPRQVTDHAFLQGLRELGYADGRNLVIDYLSADGRFERFPTLAAECVRLKADIIVAVTTPGALAAKKATSIIPIVSPATGDPVASEIVPASRGPVGMSRGLSLMAPGLSGKRLALLKETVAGISRAAVLANFADPIAAPQVKDMENAARALGIPLRAYDVRTPEALPGAFAAATRDGAAGVLVTIESLFLGQRTRVVELAARHRLPVVYPHREFVDSAGPDRLWSERRQSLPESGHVCGQDPQGRPAGRPSRCAADEVRAGDRHESRQGARSYDSSGAAPTSGSAD